jgi:predicted nucleic acid-binding Zn ribbon protein
MSRSGCSKPSKSGASNVAFVRGVNVRTLDAKRIAGRESLKESQVGRLGLPSLDEAMLMIKTQTCWWCGRNGFQSLGIHTSTIHNITAKQIREMAGLFKHTPTCSPKNSAMCRDRNLLGLANGTRNIPKQKSGYKIVFSSAGRKQQDEIKTAILLANSGNEQRAKASRKSAEKRAKPHPCHICGKVIPKGWRKTCSTECRKTAQKLTALIATSIVKERKDLIPGYRESISEKISARMKQRVLDGSYKLLTPRKPHPCPVCGTIIPKATPRACSPDCRRILMERGLSKGVKNFQTKLQNPDFKKAWAEKISLGHGGQVDVICCICGTSFPSLQHLHRKTCSTPCLLELRRRNAILNKVSQRPEVREKISHAASQRVIQRDSLGRITN